MSQSDRERWRGRPLEERLRALHEIYVFYPQLTETINFIKHKVRHSRLSGKSAGLLVILGSGGGKSTLCKYLRGLWPDEFRDDVTLRRVVVMTIPKPCTDAALAKAVLRGLGDPDCERGTEKANRHRALELFKTCGTWLWLIDNFHDIPERRKMEGVRVIGNWIRNFFDKANVVLVALGLEAAEDVLLFNDQVHRRIMATKRIDFFAIDTPEHAKVWVRVLHDIDEAMPLAGLSGLDSRELRWRLYFATNGIFGYLFELLGEALDCACKRGAERIEMDDLFNAFVLCHGDVVEGGNPFASSFRSRRLDGRREPFNAPALRSFAKGDAAADGAHQSGTGSTG
jgi:hypothetical protein